MQRVNVTHINMTVADVDVVHYADEAELWRVTVNGQYLLGFYGPDARAQAERHRAELVEILAVGDWLAASEPADFDGPGSAYLSRSENPQAVH